MENNSGIDNQLFSAVVVALILLFTVVLQIRFGF